MNEKLHEELSEVKETVQVMKSEENKKRFKELRWMILDFASSLPARERDREEFDEIYDMHEEYENLFNELKEANPKFKNGKTDRAMKKIDLYYNEWHVLSELEKEN